MKGVIGVSRTLGEERLCPSEALAHTLKKLGLYLGRRGIKAYMVGGWVRDALLGKPSRDLDIAISHDPMTLGRQVAEYLGGTFVPLDEINRVARVLVSPEEEQESGEPWTFDFTRIRGDIEADLSLRDFTINALAIELEELLAAGHAAVIDPLGGRDDLRRGLVRAPRQEAFVEDSLRLLRGVRLAAQLGFALEPATQETISRLHGSITSAAPERIREELASILETPRGTWALRLMDSLGLLGTLIPELEETRGISQPKEHHWDVLGHSLATVAAVEALVHPDAPREDWISGRALALLAWPPALAQHWEERVGHGHSRKVTLKLAALLHDVRKPQTKAADGTGRTRFFGHAEQGAQVAANIMERLRFSARETRMVASMVEHHLRPGQMASQGPPTARAIYRYFRDTDEVGIDTLCLNLADHLASRGPDLRLADWAEHATIARHVLEHYLEKQTVVRPPKLVDGHVLMEALNLPPGPIIKRLLEMVREAQASGEVSSPEEALDLAQRELENYQTQTA